MISDKDDKKNKNNKKKRAFKKKRDLLIRFLDLFVPFCI